MGDILYNGATISIDLDENDLIPPYKIEVSDINEALRFKLNSYHTDYIINCIERNFKLYVECFGQLPPIDYHFSIDSSFDSSFDQRRARTADNVELILRVAGYVQSSNDGKLSVLPYFNYVKY